jgi:pyruvate-formate lyase-activating enzyme
MLRSLLRRTGLTRTAAKVKSNDYDVELLDGRKIQRQKRSSGPAGVADAPDDDPFVQRFKALDKTVVHPKNGPIPALKGNYEDLRDFMQDAVAENARPSRALIGANYQLAAWEAHLKIGKVSSFPVSFSVAFTDICNARCNFCAYTPERVTGDTLALEEIERLDWLKFVRLFRPNAQLGEPFAHPYVIDIFNAIRKQGPYLDLASITNGTLFLRPGVIDMIVGNFSLLYISLNATSKDVYERTMPPMKFDDLCANLAALRDAKIAAGTNQPRLDAGYVLYKGNLDDLLELPAFLHRYGFSRVNIKAMHPPPRCSKSDKLLTPDDSVFTEPVWANDVFREVEKRAEHYGIELVRPLPSLDDLQQKYGRPDHLKLDELPVQ